IGCNGAKPAGYHKVSFRHAPIFRPIVWTKAQRHCKCRGDMGIAGCLNRARRGQWLATRVVVMALALGLGGCFTETYYKGYILPDGALEQIPIGSTQEQVLIVLGTPSTVATVSGEAFYYISQRAERLIGFMPQQVVDQRVVAVYFDKSKRVERLANYGLKDGKVFDFVSRSTPTGGKDV